MHDQKEAYCAKLCSCKLPSGSSECRHLKRVLTSGVDFQCTSIALGLRYIECPACISGSPH